MEGILPFAIGKRKTRGVLQNTRCALKKQPIPSKMGWPRWNLPGSPSLCNIA
jgi:hypothetical protein